MRFSAVQTADRLFSTSLFARVLPFATKLDAAIHGDTDSAKAIRNSLTAFVIRVASAAIAFLSQVILARLMGAFEYGIFVLIWVAMVIIGNLSCLGFQTAIIRFLPQYMDHGDTARIRGIVHSGRLFVLLSSSIAALLTFALVKLGSDYLQSYYIFPMIIGVIALPMLALGDMLDGTARANGWTIRALGPTYILRPVFTLIVMLAAWQLGYPINGVTGVVCAIIATYTTTLIQYIVIRRNLDKRFGTGAKTIELRTWMIVALPIFPR
ncbi:MAG: oligosaccharide flippase family protein [Ahrensia sp.]|nr:oligosaccharide flippase family protein [Ahrensia sp.]